MLVLFVLVCIVIETWLAMRSNDELSHLINRFVLIHWWDGNQPFHQKIRDLFLALHHLEEEVRLEESVLFTAYICFLLIVLRLIIATHVPVLCGSLTNM